jgi:predicted nucleotidyltransferase/predicted transcriptional regulator with HTH domain
MLSLRSKLRRNFLAYLYANRSARFYVRGMAATLGVDPTNLSRELSRLEKEGLLQSEIEGRQRYYHINPAYPYLKPLFTMLGGSVGIVPTIQGALKGMDRVDAAYIYGSFAKNEADASSDIDLLIIGQPEQVMLAAEIRKAEKVLGREVNYTTLKPQELRLRLKAHDPFIADIWRGKRITLIEHAKNESPAD